LAWKRVIKFLGIMPSDIADQAVEYAITAANEKKKESGTNPGANEPKGA
jgi:hypothetical protein